MTRGRAVLPKLTMIALALTTAGLSYYSLIGPPSAGNGFAVATSLLSGIAGRIKGDRINAAARNAANSQFLAEKRLNWAPNDSAAWLALALARERTDWIDGKAAGALKMSYYTGFNVPALVAPRLALLVRVDVGRDPELSEFLRRQIETIVSRAPSLKPAIVTAYSEATPANRTLIEDQLASLAPHLLDGTEASPSATQKVPQ